jgi:dimeric dUTPase (all-alpha-NTP-PPase superfamily)
MNLKPFAETGIRSLPEVSRGGNERRHPRRSTDFRFARSGPNSTLRGMSTTPDQLRELFRMQKALNERIGVFTDQMDEAEKTKWILNYTRAMSQELAELTDSVPWKWWAKYQNFDAQNARVEVVDLFHFLISLAQVLGLSADDLFNAYVKKNEVNFKRQETGYGEKDHSDSKHI